MIKQFYYNLVIKYGNTYTFIAYIHGMQYHKFIDSNEDWGAYRWCMICKGYNIITDDKEIEYVRDIHNKIIIEKNKGFILKPMKDNLYDKSDIIKFKIEFKDKLEENKMNDYSKAVKTKTGAGDDIVNTTTDFKTKPTVEDINNLGKYMKYPAATVCRISSLPGGEHVKYSHETTINFNAVDLHDKNDTPDIEFIKIKTIDKKPQDVNEFIKLGNGYAFATINDGIATCVKFAGIGCDKIVMPYFLPQDDYINIDLITLNNLVNAHNFIIKLSGRGILVRCNSSAYKCSYDTIFNDVIAYIRNSRDNITDKDIFTFSRYIIDHDHIPNDVAFYEGRILESVNTIYNEKNDNTILDKPLNILNRVIDGDIYSYDDKYDLKCPTCKNNVPVDISIATRIDNDGNRTSEFSIKQQEDDENRVSYSKVLNYIKTDKI